jgi:hypothetical protein
MVAISSIDPLHCSDGAGMLRETGGRHCGRSSLKTLQRGVVAATLILSLAGCKVTNVNIYNPIDNADKTMTVPAYDSVLLEAFKQRLQKNGWRLTLDQQPTPAAGTPSLTRYSLTMRQAPGDPCYPKGGVEVNFEFVVMDNKTHDAVLTGSGRDCSDTTADKFIAAVRRATRR